MSDTVASRVFGGRYEVRKELGRGNMGIVYLALDTLLSREVALKVVRANSEMEMECHRRLLREAQAAAGCEHPNIVAIYNFEEDQHSDSNKELYIVMELIDGDTLARVLNGVARLPPVRTAYIVCDVAVGLDFAHEKGVIHRDIKAENIFIRQRDQGVKIGDFGIAKVQRAADLTLPGQVLGTPSHMSPELLDGQPPSKQSDQWALAVMTFRMLTGVLPFNTKSEIYLKHPVPTAINKDLPPAVDSVFQKALAKNARDRYESCARYSQALLAALTSGIQQLDSDSAATITIPPVREDQVEDEDEKKTAPLPVPVPPQLLTASHIALIGACVFGIVAATWLYFNSKPAPSSATQTSKAQIDRAVVSQARQAVAPEPPAEEGRIIPPKSVGNEARASRRPESRDLEHKVTLIFDERCKITRVLNDGSELALLPSSIPSSVTVTLNSGDHKLVPCP